MNQADVFHTRVLYSDGSIGYGSISYKSGSIHLELDKSGSTSRKNPLYYDEKQSFIPNESGVVSVIDLDKPVQVSVIPQLESFRPYSKIVHENYAENIHPHSSPSNSRVGWYGRMLLGRKEHKYIVQRIQNDRRFWLTILDSSTDKVLQKHIVQPYEIMPLRIMTNWERNKEYTDAIGPANPFETRNVFLSELNGPVLTWAEIATLTKNFPIQLHNRGKTARESLNYIVPEEYLSSVREEIMLFLLWTVRNPIPKEDPIKFFDNLLPLGIARNLLMGHVRCLLDGETPPDYVKLMHLAVKKRIESAAVAVDETMEPLSHVPFWTRVVEMFEAWRPRILNYARKMNQSGDIYTNLPVTRKEAIRNRDAWKMRLGMLSLGFHARSHVWPQAMGLKQILYFGASHRWNHPHLAFSVRLGELHERPPHLQVMVLPPAAVSKIMNRDIFTRTKLNQTGTLIRGYIEVGWSTRSVNYDLFKESTNTWKIGFKKIQDSFLRSSTIKKLSKKYGMGQGHYIPDEEEARVIDMVESTLYLSDMEHSRGRQYWNVSAEEAKVSLEKLKKEGVLKLTYEIATTQLTSLTTLIQGPPSSVYSLTGSLIDNTPTSLAMTSNTGEFALIISRVPMSTRQDLRQILDSAGDSSDLIVKTMIPAAFRSYTWNLYQRLLTPEGRWDDDISVFRDQILSRQGFR